MSNEEAHRITDYLDAIDDRLEDCNCVFAEDGQEAVATSTYNLAKKIINIVRTRYSIRLKLENIRVNSIGNITMKWFERPYTSKDFASGKCRYLYMEIGRSKVICYGNENYNQYGLTSPERLNSDTVALIHTVFDTFYQNK